MNKENFILYISKNYQCSKGEAKKIVEVFSQSITKALSEKQEISLVGFGSFSVIKIASRSGRNPKTGEHIQIKEYNQPKFKAGKNLKNACNE